MDTISIEELAKEQKLQKKLTRKPLMYVGMLGIVMLFAGLTSAYIVRKASGEWLSFEIPSAFYISTIIIICSSISIFWATKKVSKNSFLEIKKAMLITLILGIGFIITQFIGYSQLIGLNYYFVGSNISVSFLYIITFLHLLHILGGIIAITVSFIKSFKQKYTVDNSLGLELTAIYWHFLGILWIYLLLFLTFIN